MPHLLGTQIVEKLNEIYAQNPLFRKPLIFMMTASETTELRETAKALGIKHFHSKPLPATVVREVIELIKS